MLASLIISCGVVGNVKRMNDGVGPVLNESGNVIPVRVTVSRGNPNCAGGSGTLFEPQHPCILQPLRLARVSEHVSNRIRF